jgi:tRNA (guanine37-N1)-methyltransferase
VLLSGHHAQVAAWRRRQSLERTAERRPELLTEAQREELGRAPS